MQTSWNDLNYPARMATLASAGLPMLQRDNTGHLVATQSLTQNLGVGLFFKNIEELGAKLASKHTMHQIRNATWQTRNFFTFDYHVDKLICFFKEVIETYQPK